MSWSALKGQFGTGFRRLDHFRPVFLENLALAMAVYPDAQVEAGERGVRLLPSRPPLAPKLVAIGGGRIAALPPVKIARPYYPFADSQASSAISTIWCCC